LALIIVISKLGPKFPMQITNCLLSFTALFLFCTSIANAQKDDLTDIRTLITAGSLSEAELQLRQMLTAHPTADEHFLLGYVLYRKQDAKQSLAEYTAGAQLRRPGAYEFKVVAADYVLLKDFEDADKWLTATTNETPKDGDAWYLLGRTKYNENRFAEAVECFERALELRPQDVLAEDNLGLSLQETGQQDKAKAAFANAISWQGQDPKEAQPFMNMGSLLLQQEKPAEGLDYSLRAVTLAPKNPKTHEVLGDIYEALNKLPEAQKEYEAAISLSPDVAGLHFKLGRVERRLGLKDAAEKEYAICAQLNSSHSSKPTPNPLENHP